MTITSKVSEFFYQSKAVWGFRRGAEMSHHPYGTKAKSESWKKSIFFSAQFWLSENGDLQLKEGALCPKDAHTVLFFFSTCTCELYQVVLILCQTFELPWCWTVPSVELSWILGRWHCRGRGPQTGSAATSRSLCRCGEPLREEGRSWWRSSRCQSSSHKKSLAECLIYRWSWKVGFI